MKLDDMSRTQRLLAIGGVWLIIALFLLLIAEGAVRVRSYLMTGMVWGVEETFVTDAETGLRIPRAGLDTGSIVINSQGFRGPEIAVDKPPGTIRLAFLGGSTTYCAEVSSNDMVWPHIVTRRIQDQFPNSQFDYINGGVPGYGTRTSLRNLRERISDHSPDVIVIYHAANDLAYYTFQTAFESGLATERADERRFWLSKYSLLSHMVELNLKVVRLKNEASTETGKLVVNDEQIIRPFRENMLELVRAAKSTAPIVALATFSVQYRRDQPPEQQTKAAATSLYYMPYMTIEGLLQSFDAYNSAIRDIAAQEGVILVGDEGRIPGNSAHFKDSVHFTDAGSMKMAERVSEALLASSDFVGLIEGNQD